MTQDLTAAATGGKMTLRETIARAICGSYEWREDGIYESGPTRKDWLAQADAALEAIRAAGWAVVNAKLLAEVLDRACLTAALAAKET